MIVVSGFLGAGLLYCGSVVTFCELKYRRYRRYGYTEWTALHMVVARQGEE